MGSPLDWFITGPVSQQLDGQATSWRLVEPIVVSCFENSGAGADGLDMVVLLAVVWEPFCSTPDCWDQTAFHLVARCCKML